MRARCVSWKDELDPRGSAEAEAALSFRDDRDAMRARIDQLERERERERAAAREEEGEHRVWVGTVGGGPQPFTLTLETTPPS